MPFEVRTRADDCDKHLNDVNALIYHKGKLYSGADDGKIKCWEADLKFVADVAAHTSGSVFSLAASDDTIYSCSNDGSVKAWTLDLKPKAMIHKVKCEMWKVCFSDGLLYAGDNEGVVWVFQNNKLLRQINTMEPTKDLIVKNRVMFSVRDSDLVISEIKGDKGNVITRATIMGRAPICLAGDKLCLSRRSGMDILVHQNSYELEYKKFKEVKDAHQMIINAMCSEKSDDEGSFLYSGGWDKVVKQWKIAKGTVTPVNQCNADMCINAMTTGEKGEVYAGGSDGHIIRIDV